MLTAERAATLCQCSRRKIYHWIEEGHLHFVELADGTVLVCGKTLAKKIEDVVFWQPAKDDSPLRGIPEHKPQYKYLDYGDPPPED